MKSINIALLEDLVNDPAYDQQKVRCEDGLCKGDAQHVQSCVYLIGMLADAGIASRTALMAGKSGKAFTFNSASDERVTNNVMRHQYRKLEDDEKADMLAIKDAGLVFYKLLHRIGATPSDGERFGSRELSLAGTNIEQAVMWATKHVTR